MSPSGEYLQEAMWSIGLKEPLCPVSFPEDQG